MAQARIAGAAKARKPATAPIPTANTGAYERIRLGNSPFARIISAKASKRLTDLAISELIADKLPFTPSRLQSAPLASPIVSDAVCGATIYGVAERPLAEGMVLGGVGTIAGAFAGYYTRKRLNGDTPNPGIAVLEDALAIGGGILIATLLAREKMR